MTTEKRAEKSRRAVLRSSISSSASSVLRKNAAARRRCVASKSLCKRFCSQFPARHSAVASNSGNRMLGATFSENFFHKPVGTLNASLRQLFAFARATRACRIPRHREKNEKSRKPLFYRCFSISPKNARMLLPYRAAPPVACVGRVGQDARCGVDPRAGTLHCGKTLVFLSRCSNPNAVRAIPAGTGRYRHSLMARRAAWRRSERRRRSQRRKRARGRPSAGRRSKHALLPSLRLRTTSMTASNGPAESKSGERIAIVLRHRRLRSTTEGVDETKVRASSVSAARTK